MTKLEEFVRSQLPGYWTLDSYKQAEFWFHAFVKEVRERQKVNRRGTYSTLTEILNRTKGTGSGEAFEEIVKELGLEEP